VNETTGSSAYRSTARVARREEPTIRREYLYVAMQGGVSQARPLSEVLDELRARGVTDFSTVEMWGSFWWERPENAHERLEREARERRQRERTETWELETYARLHEKYGRGATG
jgi:hypothetical protein